MNKHIENYLDQYLGIPSPDYAVMLTGEWGCGKTHFVKKYIESRKNKKFCYISLNGIKQCNDVIPQIILALTPEKFNSKIFNGVISVGRTIACGITKFFNVNDVFNINDFSSWVSSSTIFVFDDLERTLLSPKEIFGFLSDLVEQQNLHVIIVGDETKFSGKANDEYLFRKEKIIGKTFKIQNQNEEVLPTLFKELKDTGLEGLLQEHFGAILLNVDKVRKYCKREQVNYRIIKTAIREFYFVFEDMFKDDTLTSYKSKIFEELFLRFLVMSYCLQTHSLTLKDSSICAKYYLLDEEKTEKRTAFREAFPIWVGDTFIDVEKWIDIFEYKSVNSSELIEHIRNRVSPDISNWKKLLLFYEMDDKDIETTHKAVLKEISEQEHRNPFVILHIFMTLVAMSQKGFINTQTSEIVSEAKKYLDSIGNKLSWDDVSTDIYFYWESYGGYVYHENKSGEFKEITEYLKIKMKEKCKLNRLVKYHDFINDITNEERACIKICSPEYQQTDIFSDSDPKVLWDKLEGLSPKAFRKITHYMNAVVVKHHLCNKKSKKLFDFWKQIITYGEKFLEEHPDSEKAKCLHLREHFLQELRDMVNHYEQQ